MTFFVHPSYQRKGVGSDLLGAIESVAPGLGVVRLMAEASLTGTTFYERHGCSRADRTLEGVCGFQIELEKVVG